MLNLQNNNQNPSENGSRDSYHGYPGAGSFMGQNDSSRDVVDLRSMALMFWRWKWVMAGLLLLGVLGSVYTILRSQPIYQSEGSIIITETRSSTTASGDLQNLLNTTYGIGVGSSISNELVVLRSRRLAESLADKVLETQYLLDGTRFPLLIREYNDETFPYLSHRRNLDQPVDSTEIANADTTTITRELLIRRIGSRLVADRANMDANIVSISFQSPSPLEAKWMVDQVIDTYIELSGQQNSMAASDALQFLEEERVQIEQRLFESEQQFQEYMNTTGLVEINSQTQSIIQRISDLELRRQEIRTNLVSINAGIDVYETQLDSIRPGMVQQFSENIAPTLDRYQFQLAELETEKLMLVTRNPRLRDNPEQEPQLVSINNQIESLKNEIGQLSSRLLGEDGEAFMGFLSSTDGNMASTINAIRNRLVELRLEQTQALAQQEAVQERLDLENGALDNLPENMTQLARLRRDVEINERLYESVSTQVSETARWEQTQYGRGRPLDYGLVPTSPVEPRVTFILFVGILLGGLSGGGYVLARERMNSKIDGVEKLQKLGYPILTVVPEMDTYIKKDFGGNARVEKNGSVVSSNWMSLLDVNSPIAESFRRLRNHIVYSEVDKNFQTILVTSTSKGEGKTTSAINLATILSETWERVLIIDCDLRRPFVHQFTGVDRSPGLMEVLFENVPVSEAIQRSAAKNVYILTAGNRPQFQEAKIIHSAKLSKMIEDLKSSFDRIILDTAPYGIVTDAAPLVRLADGVLVVSRFGETQVNELRQTIEMLNSIHADIIGTLITRYKYEDSADYYSYSNNKYYYSYRSYEEYQQVKQPEKKS